MSAKNEEGRSRSASVESEKEMNVSKGSALDVDPSVPGSGEERVPSPNSQASQASQASPVSCSSSPSLSPRSSPVCLADMPPEEEEEPSLVSGSISGSGAVLAASVDDDQDRRNPQYIPKRGVFYEHDDRIDTDEESEGGEVGSEAKPTAQATVQAQQKKGSGPPAHRRIPKSEAASRWGHDKFAEMDQAPKTKDELVSIYGYDIRNEDTAPRARRRRKYGRGPNKYTRKWENEDAYVKSSGRGTSHKGSRGGGSLVMKKTGKRIPSDGGEPHLTEGKEGSPPGLPQKKEGGGGGGGGPKPPHQAKAQLKETLTQAPHKKENHKTRPEHAGKNGNAAHEPRVEHIEKALSRTHINSSNNNNNNSNNHSSKSSLPSRRSQEKNVPTSHGAAPSISSQNNVESSGSSNAVAPSKPKRYSTQRQRNNANNSNSNNNNNNNNMSNASSINRKVDDSASSDPNYYKRGSATFTPKSSSEYPSTSVAYSNSTPFATTTTGGFNSRSSGGGGGPATGQTQSVPPPYMNPNGLVNYGPPPPVQYTVPVTVPVTVPLTMSLVPPQADSFSGVPLVPGPTTSNPPLLPPAAHHIGAPELIAAAALSGGVPAGNGAPPNTGYAEVRGGVTYFNPTAQAPVLMRPVNKRPKAAIPIIDPSNLSVEKTQTSSTSEGLTPPPSSSSSSSSSDKSNVDIMTSNNNNELLT